MTSKICKTCGISKNLTEYALDKNALDGRRIHCKECCNKAKKLKRLQNPEKYREYSHRYLKANPNWVIFNSAQQRAKKRGLDFNITLEDIVIPEYCPILGIKIQNSSASGGAFDSVSLDRINSSKGYVKGNIMVVSRLANMMKSSANNEQLLTFAKWVFENITEEQGV